MNKILDDNGLNIEPPIQYPETTKQWITRYLEWGYHNVFMGMLPIIVSIVISFLSLSDGDLREEETF